MTDYYFPGKQSFTSKRLAPAALLLAALIGASLATSVQAADNESDKGKGTSDETYELVGEAFARDSDELLYREFYRFNADGWPVEVIYRLPDDTLMTEKVLTQGGSPLVPSFVQRNHLNGHLVQAEVEADKLTLLYRENTSADSKQTSLSLPDGAVMDAGFDAFMQQHWDKLLAGEQLQMEFLATTQQRFVGLRVQQHPCASATEDSICFRIEAASRLLRWLLDPIDLLYRRDNRQLQQFSGVSNLVMADGETPQVVIRYDYSAQTESATAAD